MTKTKITRAPGGDTLSLQEALDHAAAQGAQLVLTEGVHDCGALVLRSGLDLELAAGAVLRFSPDIDAYSGNRTDVIAEDSFVSLMMAQHVSDIRIGGQGRIEAPGKNFIAGRADGMGTHIPARYRPRVLVIQNCENITLEGLTVHNSPMWTLHMIASRNVKIDGVTVDNDREMPNTDGVVIDACQNVRVVNCHIATADDGVVLKTSRLADGSAAGICRDILVENCHVESFSCALKIGTESRGDFENIIFSDCVIENSNRAIGIFSRDGGAVRNFIARRIRVDARQTPDGYWGSGEAITVNVVDRRASEPAGAIENAVFEDIEGTMEGAINIVADGAAGIHNLRLSRIRIEQRQGTYKGISYDMRPTRFDLAPAATADGRANAYVKDEAGNVIGLVAYPGGMPALYVSRAPDLSLEDVSFLRPSVLPEGWNAQEIVIEDAQTIWS
ncbi:glycoside hydrolase family 28 protein [Martelella alba]|uniref:Glycoside hydrolase family 28 protein n=1 Tax=Martelella alba TaxID=2590451 RepID=A0A506U090_9HYPH|nr:glycoside hydrolase family 28 protein [Martelella alba]TPW27190.1 glycoside hydrolase family 28 protein [Martelella alba]